MFPVFRRTIGISSGSYWGGHSPNANFSGRSSSAAPPAVTRSATFAEDASGSSVVIESVPCSMTPATASAAIPDAMTETDSLAPRLGLPEDIAAAVAYLVSDDGAFVTGQDIAVDGGMLAHMPYYSDFLNATAAW